MDNRTKLEGRQADAILCHGHSQPTVARCVVCRLYLCLECIFEHQGTGHTTKKLQVLTEELTQRLERSIESLNTRLIELRRREESSAFGQKLEQGIQLIDMCRDQVTQLIDRHFEDLREQYSRLMYNLGGVSRPAQDFITGKIQEYRQTISELRGSPYKLQEFDEIQLQHDWQTTLDIVDRKEEEILRSTPKDNNCPKIKLNEQALFKLGDALGQVIGFTKEPKKTLKGEAKSCQFSLGCFLQGSPHLFVYDLTSKQAVKVTFRDYSSPLRSKTIVTSSGKVMAVGGEKVQADGAVKYSREIAIFDPRFCMMRVSALLKEPRILHSVVACSDVQGRELLLVLGGKNTNRLNSYEKYDIQSNTVSFLQSYKQPLAGQSGIALGAKVYYFGGVLSQDEQPNKQILIYDLATDIWTTVLPVNPVNYISTIEPVLIAAGSFIYILGGCRKQGSALYGTTLVQCYNPKGNYFPAEEAQLPCCVYGATGYDYGDNMFCSIVNVKRDNISFGPGLPELLKVDFAKGRFYMEPLLQI